MSDKPFMPKATAVWLVENTKISFKQIADFCDLHELEIKGIADGDVAKGIKAYNPILAGQLTREEIQTCSDDNSKSLTLNKKILDIKLKAKSKNYIPLSKREDRPNSALWLIKNYPNLSPKDPVVSNLCSQVDIQNASDKADRRIAREKKQKKKKIQT
jgi:hypothetical protein